MHTQTDTAQVTLEGGADYVFTVKGNQPKLRAQLKDLPWNEVAATMTRETGHGRRLTRTIKVLQTPSWISFPGTGQVAQLRRTRTAKGKKTVEVVYLITSTDFDAAPPQVLADFVRGHWGIENRLHWVRDVNFDDRSQVRTGNTPQVMASLRNTAITLFRLAGHTNITAALRENSYRPSRYCPSRHQEPMDPGHPRGSHCSPTTTRGRCPGAHHQPRHGQHGEDGYYYGHPLIAVSF